MQYELIKTRVLELALSPALTSGLRYSFDARLAILPGFLAEKWTVWTWLRINTFVFREVLARRGRRGVSAPKLEHIILMMCSCSGGISLFFLLFFLNICLTSQSIKFLLWTTNLAGDGWASGKIEQLCDWSLITERFICQMSLPFGGSDLLGFFWQPPFSGYTTLFGELKFGMPLLWVSFIKTQLFDLTLL